MEPINGVASYRNRQSPSSDRFLNVFSPPSSEKMISGESSVNGDDELNEDDVFWTGDFTEQPKRHVSNQTAKNRQSFLLPEKFGILAALPEDNNRKPNRPVLSTTSKTSSSRMIPSIPRPKLERESSHSMPSRKFQHSAPVNVPLFSRKVCNGELADVDVDEEGEEEMLPPHEIVVRGSSKNSTQTTFSVLEGAGRTLKGRDLRLVRNAVWRKTGFLD